MPPPLLLLLWGAGGAAGPRLWHLQPMLLLLLL
jgi:hypothetical protein